MATPAKPVEGPGSSREAPGQPPRLPGGSGRHSEPFVWLRAVSSPKGRARLQGLGFSYRAAERRLHAPGFRLQAPGSRLQTPGSRLQAPGSRLQAPGSKLQASSSRLQAPSSRLQAPRSRLQAPGSRLQAPGQARSGRDAPPGRGLGESYIKASVQSVDGYGWVYAHIFQRTSASAEPRRAVRERVLPKLANLCLGF